MLNTLQSEHEALKSALQAQMLDAKRRREAAEAAEAEAQREMDVVKKYEELMRRKALNGVSVQSQTPLPTPAPAPIAVERPAEVQEIIFATLTKEGAAETILKEFGVPKPLPAIYDEMKARGHPVLNLNAMRTLMSKSKKFIKLGDRRWWFRDLAL